MEIYHYSSVSLFTAFAAYLFSGNTIKKNFGWMQEFYKFLKKPAPVRRCSTKYVFLKNSRNLQEKISTGSLFKKRFRPPA